MKRIIYLFFMGMVCALNSIGQPFDVTLNSAQQGNITVQARNSITLAAGYNYSPNGGIFQTQIINPVITGFTSYAAAVNPSTYSINTSLAVGQTPGELNVSGMANYTVPLNIPKGSAGLQPNLSLNYMSSFNDGLLGIGWNIGGLSSISRVGQNLYFETQSNPIKGDLTDKYAMDGKRLIVTSGTYGTDGSVYGTELEEFSKITAKDPSGTGLGPAWFEVRTKSGFICEYGNTTDSKVLRDATVVLTWKINKITDRYGNCITFTYFESDDERPILQIRYAGSSSTLAEVNFRYKQRSDMSTYVYGGNEFTRDILLDNIEIKNNGQTYKKYVMEYMLDNYAQLQKITEYSSQNQPLNPLVFTYTKQTEQFNSSTFFSITDKRRYFNGDFNGDGRVDFVSVPAKTSYNSSDMWSLYLGTSSGQMSYQVSGNLDSNFMDFIAADYNGDGLTDLMKINMTYPYSLSYFQSTGTGFTINPSNCPFDPTANIDVIDYNGDGLLEILVRKHLISDTEEYTVYSYTGQIIMQDVIAMGKFLEYRHDGHAKICDFNGDGCSDFLALFENDYKILEFKGVNGKLSQTDPGNTKLNSNQKIFFDDFNGDGKTEILKIDGLTHSSWTLFSFLNGGLIERSIYGFTNFDLNLENNRVFARDMNADGRSDIVFIGKGQSTSNSSNRINVALNKGNGFDYITTEYVSPVNFNIGYQSTNPNITWEQYELTTFIHYGDYDGDGRVEFFYKDTNGNSKLFSFASGTPSNLLSNVIDGYGVKTQITYLPMSNSTVYARGTGATYPVCDFSSGMQLVRQVDSDDGIGGLFTATYKYDGAKIHLKGKGFLGFAKTTQTNSDTGISTENNFAFDSPYYYPKLMTSYTKLGSTAISTTTNNWGTEYNYGNYRIFPYISSTTQTDNLKNLSVTSSVVYPTSNLYGNPTSVTKIYSSGPSKTTSFLYDDEKLTDWLIGRPTTITETSTSGSDTQTYVTTRTYIPTSNDPDIDQNNTGDTSWWLKNRGYSTMGNLEVEYLTTSGLTDSHTNYSFDNNGVNLLSKTERDGTVTSMTYYPATNLLNTQTDPFGNVVTYNYNSSDQLSTITPSTGITTTITSSYVVTGGPTNARYYVDKTGNDGSQSKVWYDKLGRELRTETKKYGGTLVKVDKQYNAKGELAQYSEPSTGTPSTWNVIAYDNYSRVSSLDPVFGPTTTYTNPNNNAITTRTVNGRNYKTTENGAGWVIATEDPGGVITNNYWPNGLLKSTVAPGTVTTDMTYDRNGNRLTITDPNAGMITNTWYGTGQPKTTANADGQTTTYTYNANEKVQLQKTTSPEGETSYTYYSNGLVNTVTSPGGITRSYTYELGKVKTITESISGTISNTVTFEYDTKGRLFKKYFNGTTEYEQYDYDAQSGYLYRIQFTATGVSTTTVWQLTTMDEYKRITQASIGSIGSTWSYDSGTNLLSGISATGVQGYSYSFNGNTGNLSTRTNTLRSKFDNFGYDSDNLDRLTVTTGSSPTVSVAYTTNKNGNIETKGDAGTYEYHPTKVYAVNKITGGQNISNDPQQIDYYSFEKVKKITEGTTTIKTADFDYNADLQRIRMVLKTNGTVTKTRYYFGSSCEREVVGTTTTQYIWIGGDAYTAVAVAQKVGTGAWTVYNIFRDHLGTITHLKTGSTITEYSFDAWGRRRDKDDWTTTLTSEPALFADRGFTGHEYLDDFKLYNMNGRLYDPVVGRFLSPDPYVQDPGFTQNLNRYSYCLNNPLKFNDPSGEFFWSIITGVVDFVSTALFKGGLDPTSSSARNNAWRNFDPTASWSNTNKAWKIDMGLFKTDPNKNFWGRSCELISRFTWQAPQTALGYTGTGIHNLLGGVRSVDYYGGATVVESYSENWGAITLGSYINGSRGMTANPNDRLFQHEYGHYIQSQTSGLFYLSKYGIPSALSKNGTDHGLHPAEQDANIRAFKYFNKHIDGYSGWVHTGINGNPINGYDPSLPYDDPANQSALKDGRLRLSWYDYLLGPQIILPGLLNALILNNRY